MYLNKFTYFWIGFVRYKEVKEVNKLLSDVRSAAVGPHCITINEAKYNQNSTGTELTLPKASGLPRPPDCGAWKKKNLSALAQQETRLLSEHDSKGRATTQGTQTKPRSVIADQTKEEIFRMVRSLCSGRGPQHRYATGPRIHSKVGGVHGL